MRCLNFRFSLNNPFLHGIAIGLVLALCFPQASLASQISTDSNGNGIDSLLVYSLIDVTDENLMQIHQTVKKACGFDAISFTLNGGPLPATGDYPAVSNEGHLADITITRFEPLLKPISLPTGITKENADAIYCEELSRIKAEFMAEATISLNDFALDSNIDPSELGTPSFPVLPDKIEDARKAMGVATVTIAGLGDVIHAEAIVCRTKTNDIQTTYLMPLGNEITFEYMQELEAMTSQNFLNAIDGPSNTDETPDIEAA